jgi:thiol-disulfide isomerase/thioredoxin
MRNAMPVKALIIGGIIAISALIAWWDHSHHFAFSPPQALNVEPISGPAPNFTFPHIDSKEKTAFKGLKSKHVLINVWASWCAPCIKEFPLLVELAKAHPDTLTLLLLSVDNKPDQALAFAQKYGATKHKNILLGWDQDKQISDTLFGITQYPESILIAPDLMLKEKIIGMLTDENIQTISAYIE